MNIESKREEVIKVSNDSVLSAGNEVIVETVHDTRRPIGGRAIAGALARTKYNQSNRPDQLQYPPSPIAWQQWGDWDNGHADS